MFCVHEKSTATRKACAACHTQSIVFLDAIPVEPRGHFGLLALELFMAKRAYFQVNTRYLQTQAAINKLDTPKQSKNPNQNMVSVKTRVAN